MRAYRGLEKLESGSEQEEEESKGKMNVGGYGGGRGRNGSGSGGSLGSDSLSSLSSSSLGFRGLRKETPQSVGESGPILLGKTYDGGTLHRKYGQCGERGGITW